MNHSLKAISPVDGRYADKTAELAPYFSESALIKYRVLVEVNYLFDLVDFLDIENGVTDEARKKLEGLYNQFEEKYAEEIKTIEKTTNHDVKAVEYFLRNQLEELNLDSLKEWVHFGLTSQDINNTAIPLSLKEAVQDVYHPLLDQLIGVLEGLANEWKNIPMLARTHGQPASPTRLGKEIMVFAERLKGQRDILNKCYYPAKFGGATGNMNAHHVAFPDKNWVAFADHFVEKTLGLHRSKVTTQIEHYDHLAAIFHVMLRINTIVIDLNRDFWQYISQEYFKQKIKKGEVGSSAMPHKVNPIDFENSEGNLGLANALFSHLAEKLPISRLQRDLTDSTVLRNIGLPVAYTVIAIKSTLKGLGKLLLNESKLNKDLEDNWAVVAEAIQTILRRENYLQPYEALKGLTRTNSVINRDSIHQFIDTLDVSAAIKTEMKQITPQNYTGIQLY